MARNTRDISFTMEEGGGGCVVTYIFKYGKQLTRPFNGLHLYLRRFYTWPPWVACGLQDHEILERFEGGGQKLGYWEAVPRTNGNERGKPVQMATSETTSTTPRCGLVLPYLCYSPTAIPIFGNKVLSLKSSIRYGTTSESLWKQSLVAPK